MSAARRFRARTFAALSVRNFRLYFIGQLISVSGTWMQSVAQGWLILQLTGSSVGLGIAIALQYVPMLLFGTYGGLVVDRHEKRRILYLTQSSAGALALVLGILVTTHHATVPAVWVLATLLGFVNLFDVPARQAFVQEMVGHDLLANAVSLNSVLMNSGRLIGPSIAAGFIAVVGTAACFYANAASYAAVLVALMLMRGREFLPLATVTRQRGQLRLGLRYVMATPTLRNVVLAVAVVGTFAFNFTVTLPLLARITFHESSAAHYGLLMGAMGLGAVVGGLFIAWRSRPTTALLVVLGAGFGVFMALVAIAPTVTWAEILLIPTGAFSVAFVSTANATLQLNSSQEMRGRVMSLHGMAFLGTTPIGAPLVGLIIAASDPRVGLLLGAASALAAAGLLVAARRAP
ncbi:MAG TPA: MFS transporter, partial [Acidimicrobiales bacterium]|nr:MFS transporter [Acidimicrobiales bacterium]